MIDKLNVTELFLHFTKVNFMSCEHHPINYYFKKKRKKSGPYPINAKECANTVSATGKDPEENFTHKRKSEQLSWGKSSTVKGSQRRPQNKT